MKLRELPYFLGIRPGPRTYGYEVRRFDLPAEGAVFYAQWLHPSETPKQITQQSVDSLREFLVPGDVAIDIGAHTGDSTVPMALAVGKTGWVLALEPNRYVFPVLKANAELNPEKTRIVPLMFAATPADGEMEFSYSDAGYCNGGRFEGMSKWSHGHAFRLPVQGRNLQALLEAEYPQLLKKIRYVKIDTEGYELAVLRSLAKLISDCRPYLRLEVYRRLEDAQRRELYGALIAYGYTVHKANDAGPSCRGERLTENDLSRWRHFDVFCVPAG